MMTRKSGRGWTTWLGAIGAMTAVVLISPLAARAETSVLAGKEMRLEIDHDPFALRVLDRTGAEMLVSDGPVAYTTVSHQHVSRFVLWWVWDRGWERPWTKAERVTAVEKSGDELVLVLGAGAGRDELVRLRAWFVDAKTLRVELEAIESGVNRFKLHFKRSADDRYYGMGERFNRVEHGGEEVRVWAEEGGLGLSYLSEVWPQAGFNPFPIGQDMTYYPMPYYLNPAKGYAFLLDDVRFSRFDFGKTDASRVEIENYNSRFDLMLFSGDGPLELIEEFTAHTGRITVPKPWVFAPMNAVVEDEDRVLEVARLVREEKIPTSAIWTESWWWRTEWEVNRKMFPDYEGMIAQLHADGFRHLGYYQPYISVKSPTYQEADAMGYLTQDAKGRTYPFYLGRKKAQLDVTNPEAVTWWKESFFAKSEAMGVDGWMHDFGEHTPPDSVAYDGRTGWELHNEYSLIWARIGREFWDQARPDGDYCFYIRGGYTGAQRYASVMWTGDQNSNFERYDGLPSNIPGILSVGVSGHPICTTDIAGYNCFVNQSADRELFMRWTELGALLPVMRLHRGNDEVCEHWSFDQDRATLEHYKRQAVLHTALFPYFYTLAHEAAQKGWPVIRHLMLHYPKDPAVEKLDHQFLIGDRLLAAPVLKRDARKLKLYLPEGEWTHWWSGDLYTGPGWITVAAELGEVPLFLKTGRILPLFDAEIDTLIEEDRPDVAGWDEANASIKVVFAGIGKDEYRLWDGTRITCSRSVVSSPGVCEVKDDPVGRSFSFEFR